MIIASVVEKIGRVGPPAQRALAILDLGMIAGVGLICYEPLLLRIYLMGFTPTATTLLLAVSATPLVLLAAHALRIFGNTTKRTPPSSDQNILG